MDSKSKSVKQVYVHKVANTLKVERGQFNTDGHSQSVLHYKRLVVPANMRSIYWKCYGFPASDDNEILTRSKIVCLLCKSQMTYNRNTTNLRMHLQNKHKNELAALEVVQPLPSSKTGKIDKRSIKRPRKTKADQSVVQVYPVSSHDDQASNDIAQYVAEIDDMNPLSVIVKEATSNQSYALVDGKAIAEAIAEFIVMDMQNPEIVEGKGFQRLVGTLKSPCEIPKKSYLTDELIPNIYDVVKEQLYMEIASLSCSISLSVEDWISSSGDYYSTIALHFIHCRENELQTRVLSTLYCSEIDGEQWGNQFDLLMEEYKIQGEKVRAIIVASNRDDVYNALLSRGYTIIPCFSHLLQSVCTRYVYERPNVNEVLRKCRAFIAHVSRNSTASAEMRLQDNLLQLEEQPMVMDNKASWMSTLTMLEQMQARRNVLASVLDCLSTTICPTTTLELTAMDWAVLDDVVNILSPFKVTIATLVEEKSPLISILKPIMCQLLNVHLEKSATDSDFSQTVKADIAEVLIEKYRGESVSEVLELSSALDPRFKNLPFLTDEDRSRLRNKILSQLNELVTSPESVDHGKTILGKKRVSGMEYLLGELCTIKCEMEPSQKTDMELVQYEWEPQANLEKSPIEWWRDANGKCYHVSRLAAEYLCTPVCVRSHLQQTLCPAATLQSLPPHLATKMKFLNTNYVPSD
ncbi:E3 SUMO-protein ligase ZBED1 [Halyomorpha halys]|uniref:E3 SUMO-protein ligase ZBED1 n=1 Tax=Halyomorpha halys TaxID=286706 RepID=UPI0006D4F0B0|nr:zinc finger BED domain-containing protein 1-like isoform X1 [Halyomorpha halys]